MIAISNQKRVLSESIISITDAVRMPMKDVILGFKKVVWIATFQFQIISCHYYAVKIVNEIIWLFRCQNLEALLTLLLRSRRKFDMQSFKIKGKKWLPICF